MAQEVCLKLLEVEDRSLVICQLPLEKDKVPANGSTKHKETVADRMVAAGATCLATSAVSLPTPHCQAVLNNTNKMAMNAAMVDQLRQRLLLFVENVRAYLFDDRV